MKKKAIKRCKKILKRYYPKIGIRFIASNGDIISKQIFNIERVYYGKR